VSERPIRPLAEIEACRRKRRFASEREADDAAYQARLEGKSLNVYSCIWCRGWHLTSRQS
jgi:hypothetical protein